MNLYIPPASDFLTYKMFLTYSAPYETSLTLHATANGVISFCVMAECIDGPFSHHFLDILVDCMPQLL